MLTQLIAVFIGGGFGATLRFFLSELVNSHCQKLWAGTLLVNLLGCLIYYLSFKYFNSDKFNISIVRLGFCGSLTTFSTFSFEVLTLFQNGEITQALLVVFLNVALGITLGYFIL